jgi:hypothetical protein
MVRFSEGQWWTGGGAAASEEEAVDSFNQVRYALLATSDS